MHELTQEIEDALSDPLHGRQWAKDLFWDLLSFDRVASSLPIEVLPSQDRWGISESLTWARLGDIRVGLFKKSKGAWGDDRLDAIACKVGQVWRNALMLFADEEERHWHLVVCSPRVEGQAGVSRRLDMVKACQDRRVIGLITQLSPETSTPTSKAMHDLWLVAQPMHDVVTRMEYQLTRKRKRQVRQSGFLKFIQPYAMHPFLRKSEELELGRRIQDGDRDAWHTLIEHNVRMGFWGASRFGWSSTEFEECFQYSMTGLMHAAEKFDPSHGTRFSTYAHDWMWQKCQRGCEELSTFVHLPANQHKPLREYIKRKARQSIREAPWSAEDWAMDRIARLSTPVSIHSARDEIYQEACDELDPSTIVQQKLDQQSRMSAIQSILSEAAPRDQNIISHRFGLINGEELTLEECGQMHGVTRERVRQVEKKQIARLRRLILKRHSKLFGELIRTADWQDENKGPNLDEHQILLCQVIRENPPCISSVELSNAVQLSTSVRKAAIRVLIKNGVIERIGQGRSAVYRLAETNAVAGLMAERVSDAAGQEPQISQAEETLE